MEEHIFVCDWYRIDIKFMMMIVSKASPAPVLLSPLLIFVFPLLKLPFNRRVSAEFSPLPDMLPLISFAESTKFQNFDKDNTTVYERHTNPL